MKRNSLQSILLVIIGILFPYFVCAQQNNAATLLIGTYTSGKSEGIYVYEFNMLNGKLTYKNQSPRIDDPSFLAATSDYKYIYAVQSLNEGAVSAFSFNQSSGGLEIINTVSTEGAGPCYVTVDPKQKFVVVGNYSSGDFSVHSIQQDGALSDCIQRIEHKGSGINKSRQEGPHVHSADFSPDGRFLFVCDLGIDQLIVYPFDANRATQPIDASKARVTKVKEGSGPRHIVFHPNGRKLYLIQELTGEITAFKYHKGNLSLIGSYLAKPDNATDDFTAAEIITSADGKFLYVSNRGTINEIVCFAIDGKSGKLKFVSRTPSLGQIPRHITIDPSGNWLLAGHQQSDDIIVFRRNVTTGMLEATSEKVNIGAPVHLLFVKVKQTIKKGR